MGGLENLTSILLLVVMFLLIAIALLGFVYWYMSYKKKVMGGEKNKTNNTTSKIQKGGQYTPIPISDFMQFDKIEDNMIIQDNGEKYLMVLACEGVNYDLMSEVEKNSVELGFQQFLSTLRFPIQLYIQTRTVNIEDNIRMYKERLRNVEVELYRKQKEQAYIMQNPNSVTEKEKQETKLELLRLQNLYDYGIDVIHNIEATSKSKNVLKKSYYIVIPYYASEIGTNVTDEEGKRSIIFSELYVRAQSIVRTLFMSSVKAKIMNSVELMDLLYVAYNRDDSEIFGINKALEAGYDELYSTAPDALDKRMKALDKDAETKAIELAQEAINSVKASRKKTIDKKEENFKTLVREMAEKLLKENRAYIGLSLTEKAIENVRNSTEDKEGNVDDQKTKKRTRANASKNA